MDEVVEKLKKLPPGINQKTIDRNLGTVRVVWYEHWEMHPHSKRAMMPHGEANRLDGQNRRKGRKLTSSSHTEREGTLLFDQHIVALAIEERPAKLKDIAEEESKLIGIATQY